MKEIIRYVIPFILASIFIAFVIGFLIVNSLTWPLIRLFQKGKRLMIGTNAPSGKDYPKVQGITLDRLLHIGADVTVKDNKGEKRTGQITSFNQFGVIYVRFPGRYKSEPVSPPDVEFGHYP